MMMQASQLFFPPKFNTYLLGYLLLVVFLTFAGCAKSRVSSDKPIQVKDSLSTEVSKQFKPLLLNSVVVYPLESEKSLQLRASDEEHLSELLIQALDIESGLEILNSSESAGVKQALNQTKGVHAPIQSRAKALAQELGATGVIYGIVTKYSRDRQGTSMGSFRPADAGFRLWLLDLNSQAIVWSATFDKRQQPLSDNLFQVGDALKHGVGFRSSEQLIEQGFHEAAKALELLRQGAAESDQ